MEQFKTEEEMLIELDNFIFKCKGLNHNPLRMRLTQKINDFLYENDLMGGQHDFVTKKKKTEKK
jgi:hypothetical protein